MLRTKPALSSSTTGSHHHGTTKPYPSNKPHRRASLLTVGSSTHNIVLYGLACVVFCLVVVILPLLFHAQVDHAGQTTLHESNLRPPDMAVTTVADAVFNSIPVTYQEGKPFVSTVHCVGETHDESTAWMYRSCHFTNLCFDVNSTQFFVVPSPHDQALQQRLVTSSFISTSFTNNNNNTSRTPFLALGGINPRWQGRGFNLGIEKVKWFPTLRQEPPSAYYLLPSNVVLLPFHSFAAHNVGHLLWDDFLPIFTLLDMFGMIPQTDKEQHQLLLLRYILPQLLYGTCEMRRSKAKKCYSNLRKFLPLLGVDPTTFSTTKDTSLVRTTMTSAKRILSKETNQKTTIVCARHAVAGLGMLTDHGWKDHGWDPQAEQNSNHRSIDNQIPTMLVQNVGKGSLLYRFRNFMVQQLLVNVKEESKSSSSLSSSSQGNSKFRIVLSMHSSGDAGRDVDFVHQQHVLSKAFPEAMVESVQMANLTLQEQVRLASQTSVFLTVCGGGAMTATFLPRHATLILYYPSVGSFDFAQFNTTGGPAYLDWDLFNNAAYLRVHWLPIETMNTKQGIQSLLYLIRHEMMDVSANMQNI